MSPSFSNVLAAIVASICLVGYQSAMAESPTVGSALPAIAIDNHGQLALDGEDITYTPWRSDAPSENIQVIQYLAATMNAKDIFAPFTDRLQSDFEEGAVEVTSIINLKAALWGTSGLVMSEIKKNKRKHPESNFVLDKKGHGASEWGLGKKGSALLIVDAGTVKFSSETSLSEAELESAIALLQSLLPAKAVVLPAQ
ncbi:MAG: YtfJ family protein [Halioglobus sp.]